MELQRLFGTLDVIALNIYSLIHNLIVFIIALLQTTLTQTFMENVFFNKD